MFELLNQILAKIHLAHFNVLLLLGLALFGGTVGGRLFQKLRIPQVVGYIAIGILLGETGLKIVSQDIIEMLQPINYFALGLIGFTVGGELKKTVFAKHGKQFMTILFCEGITPFIFVTVLIGVFGSFLFDWKLAWALGLLFGAIASATDPATTTEVFREYKTRGPLTTTIMSIVALDDGLALTLFALASSIAGSIMGRVGESIFKAILHPLFEIAGSIALGAVLGFVLSVILNKYSEKERLLAFTIGLVLLVTGMALALHLELLLVAMTVGIVVVNFTPRKSKELFQLLGGFTPPLYVLFFVFIGAKLDLSHMTTATLMLVGLYLVGTMAGKMMGSFTGAHIAKAPPSVKKYLSLGLFSQAGVAIGLSILAAQYFPGEISNIVIVVITATTFILQLIGPPLTKIAVTKAGEVGLNVSEEDLMYLIKTEDVMDRNMPLIHKNMSLSNILKVFSADAHLYYPVVDNESRLIGVVTVDSIKQTLTESDLSDLVVAYDLIEPVHVSVKKDTLIVEVKELLDKHGLEYLPVTDNDNKMVGFIERRTFNKLLSTRMLELQRRSDALADE